MKLTITRILLILFSLTIISCRQSDDHITDPGTGTGQTEVRINLKGSEFSNENPLGSWVSSARINDINMSSIQTEEILFNNNDDYKLVATLTPESSNSNKKVGITAVNPLPNGIRYNVGVFDSRGKYVTERIYFTGKEGSMPAITGLNGGSTYTFIVYSVGTATGLPAISFTDPNNKTLATATLNDVSRNVDLMYFSKTITIFGNNTNYLDVVLQHKYSQITTTIDSVPTKYYTIESITNANITHYNSATLNLSNGSVTRTGNSSRDIMFSGSGTTLTASPVFFNTEATTTGIFKIETSVLKNGNGFQVTHQNLSFNNLKISPGVKYNLKLSFVPNDRYIANFRGYPAVSINGVIFMRHNLGANYTANPDIPSLAIAGNYYQWGRTIL